MKYVEIKNQRNLIRDLDTKAILNKNNNEKIRILQRRKERNVDKQKIQELEESIKNLENLFNVLLEEIRKK
jgi:tetrahydromethanopterin S-methyltransferase subunit B